MEHTVKKTNHLISEIFEYQKHIIFSKLLCKEFEQNGLDTQKLKEEIAEIEAKITELKLNSGFYQQ